MKRLLSLFACLAIFAAPIAHGQEFNCSCGFLVPNDANATKDKIDFMCTNMARVSFDPGKQPAKNQQYRNFCVQQITQATAACAPTDTKCIKAGYEQSRGPMSAKCLEICKAP